MFNILNIYETFDKKNKKNMKNARAESLMIKQRKSSSRPR